MVTAKIGIISEQNPGAKNAEIIIREMIRQGGRHGEIRIAYDSWSGKNIAIKRVPPCVVCSSRLFQVSEQEKLKAVDFHDPDPRSAFGERHAASHLIAAEYDEQGIDVPLCFRCANDGEKYREGLGIARQKWALKA